MRRLKPLSEVRGQLVPDVADAWIHTNSLQEEGTVVDNDDVGGAFHFRQFHCPFPLDTAADHAPLLILDGQTLISTVTVSAEGIGPDLVAAVRHDLRRLPEPLYEIWHRDHPLTEPPHLPDPWGSVSLLLERLRARVPLVMPPMNHEKVSSRREDRFGHNHMHVDTFFGMRTDASGRRAVYDRYFFNLGPTTREILVAPFSPVAIEELLPRGYIPDAGQGSTRFLDPLLEAAEWSVPLICLSTPPADWQASRIHGLKIRATHVLHGEYGARDDLLAVVTTAPL